VEITHPCPSLRRKEGWKLLPLLSYREKGVNLELVEMVGGLSWHPVVQ